MKNLSGRPDKFCSKRGPAKSRMRQAAEEAGMSRHQMYQAVQIASIPEEDFEQLVQSDDPPSLSDLARVGRGKQERKQIISAYDRLRRAWKAASDEERARFRSEVLK